MAQALGLILLKVLMLKVRQTLLVSLALHLRKLMKPNIGLRAFTMPTSLMRMAFAL